MLKSTKTKCVCFVLAAVMLIFPTTSCSNIKNENSQTKKVIKIGISIYNQSDTFITSLMNNLYELAKIKESEQDVTITIIQNSASDSQISQNNQVDDYINAGCDVICINLVDRTDAFAIIEKAKNADIPIIFFNRELVEEDLERWDKLYYVGAVALESGKLQGQIVVDYCKENFDIIDKNNDGIIQYVMLEGEAGHQDAIMRTEYVANTITNSGYQLECLSDEIANWSLPIAKTKMNSILQTYGESIELVIANNDDMALGAIEAINEFGLENKPIVVGIDGTDVGLQAVKNGDMLGTVLNDSMGQADGLLELAYTLGMNIEWNNKYELLQNKYIRTPYKIITENNIDQFYFVD